MSLKMNKDFRLDNPANIAVKVDVLEKEKLKKIAKFEGMTLCGL